MAFDKKTVKDIDLKGKRVLLRADYNVPFDQSGRIAGDYRIEQSLETIRYLLSQDCRVVICSHLGRPKRADDITASLAPVAKRLSELLGKEVKFVNDCVGQAAETAASKLKAGEVLLLENLRFHEEEEANDESFAKRLAGFGEVFVQDGFGVVHRAHASTDAVTKFLPSVAGLLLAREIDTITEVISNPKRPLMAIIGGAKISDKIDVLDRFIDIADVVAVGGAMANTFLLARGIDIAKSKAEPEDVPLARDIIEKAADKSKRQQFLFCLPTDGVVATKLDKTAKTRIVDWGAHCVPDIEHYPKRPPVQEMEIKDDEMILDIGPLSGSFIAGAMQLTHTVIWNGTMGVTEVKGLQGPVGPFAHGTELVVEAMLGAHGNRPFSLVGGGDTAAYIEERGLIGSFNHVSTGGGASIELMSGKELPGVEALLGKDK